MRPTALATAALWLVFAGCGPRVVVQEPPPVLVPPRVDLTGLEQIGVVQFRASEANGVVATYNRLTEKQKQDMLNFLRSL